ncbi:MAG: hypothetical protein JW913_03785 [Chitinispirillaceae bacterium]|nr:hypothetical protein [Chitinispirillaceae bacterium]
MIKRRMFISAAAVLGLLAGNLQAEPSPNFKVFLCFGQSNISGGDGVTPGTDEKKTTDRVMALAFNSCSNPSWQKDTWVPAREPLHCGDGGSGNNTMGPCYVFGKIMADSLPNDTIGLIPCGQSGVNIEHFFKGTGTCNAGYCVPYPNKNNTPGLVYDWMLKKCQKAVERGVFAGIFLHQGESNTGDGAAWLTKVKTIYDDLKKDIPLAKDVPIVAGQLLGNSALNSTIANMSTKFTFGSYASSSGLQGGGTYASLHFNQAGYRTLAQRYAVEMMKGLRAAGLVTGTKPQQRVISAASVGSLQDNANVYALDGKFISTGAVMTHATSFRPGNIYVVANKTAGSSAKLMIAPTAR